MSARAAYHKGRRHRRSLPCLRAVINASDDTLRGRHASGNPRPTKRHSPSVPLNQALATVGGAAKTPSYIRTGMPILQLREICTKLHGRKLRDQTTCLVPTMTVAVYFGELTLAMAVAIALLAISTPQSTTTAVLFCCGVAAWTLAEYIAHRFVLHAIARVQHGIHHARPQDAIDKIFWQIWLAFGLLYLVAGSAVLAGVLVGYAWYLFVHYCVHHNPAILPDSLLKHHCDHHRFANRNYGVTTKLWDHVFGTMLR
jgi:hypothetical protein